MSRKAAKRSVIAVVVLLLAGVCAIMLGLNTVAGLATTAGTMSAFFSDYHWPFTALRAGVGLAIFVYWREFLCRVTAYRGEALDTLVAARNRVFLSLLLVELILNQNALSVLWRL